MKFLAHVEGYFANGLAFTKSLFQLMKLEAKLAGLSIFHLVIYLSALVVLIFTSWSTLLVAIGYTIYLFTGYLWLTFVVIAIIHIFLLFIVIKSILSCIRKMSFEKTRAVLRQGEI